MARKVFQIENYLMMVPLTLTSFVCLLAAGISMASMVSENEDEGTPPQANGRESPFNSHLNQVCACAHACSRVPQLAMALK